MGQFPPQKDVSSSPPFTPGTGGSESVRDLGLVRESRARDTCNPRPSKRHRPDGTRNILLLVLGPELGGLRTSLVVDTVGFYVGL